jgi:hypothetical protein
MKLEVTWNKETTCWELLDGVTTLGGGPGDGVLIPTVPAGLLELRIDAGRVVVSSRERFTVNGVPTPAGVPRLVMSGEQLELPGPLTVRFGAGRALPEPVGTAAILRALLADEPDLELAQCASLTCLTGLDVGRQFPLAGAQAELGRGDQVDIRVRDRAVSRKHARIRQGPEGFTIEDLGAPNGVYVNAQRIGGPALLADGALIELGQSVLRFKAPCHPRERGAAADAASPVTPPDPSPPEPAPVFEPGSWKLAGGDQRADWALVGLGAALALAGAIVASGFLAG